MTLHFQPHRPQAHSSQDPGGKSPSSLLGQCRKTEASPVSLQIQQQSSSLGTQSVTSVSSLNFPALGPCHELLLPLSKQDFSRAQSVGCLFWLLQINTPSLAAWALHIGEESAAPEPIPRGLGKPWIKPAPTGEHQGLPEHCKLVEGGEGWGHFPSPWSKPLALRMQATGMSLPRKQELSSTEEKQLWELSGGRERCGQSCLSSCKWHSSHQGKQGRQLKHSHFHSPSFPWDSFSCSWFPLAHLCQVSGRAGRSQTRHTSRQWHLEKATAAFPCSNKPCCAQEPLGGWQEVNPHLALLMQNT